MAEAHARSFTHNIQSELPNGFNQLESHQPVQPDLRTLITSTYGSQVARTA
jgi:hypothetical protein